MDYRIFSMSSGEDENSTEAHVFARAYRGVWRAIYGSEPAGRHQVAALGFVVDFGVRAPARVGYIHTQAAAPTARRAAPASAAEDVPTRGRHDN